MLLDITEEQVVQLAPDAASVKAGKGLANPAKWVLLEYSDSAIWGHCQGSGKVPYQTVVDIGDIAFKCSCPSRKFPCKHGLGLLFLYVAHPERFKPAENPDWVAVWLAKRGEKAEKKEQRVKRDAPVDEAAQAKRQEQRHKKVLDGICDLQVWVKDLLRNGLVNVPERAPQLFDNIARRMVDAQAPGLANRLKALGDIDFYDDRWKYQLTDGLSRLYLLTESYKNINAQSDDWQIEIRTLIGFPQARETVLAGQAVADNWLVLHKRSRKVNDLLVETFWLYGAGSKKIAVYLNFQAHGTLADVSLVPGCVYAGDLCYYGGVSQTRALFKRCELSQEQVMPEFCHDLDAASEKYRETMQKNPLIESVPVFVDGLIFVREETASSKWYVRDVKGRTMPVSVDNDKRIDILSITGGQPFAAFMLAGNFDWEIMSIWYQSDYYIWKDELY